MIILLPNFVDEFLPKRKLTNRVSRTIISKFSSQCFFSPNVLNYGKIMERVTFLQFRVSDTRVLRVLTRISFNFIVNETIFEAH